MEEVSIPLALKQGGGGCSVKYVLRIKHRKPRPERLESGTFGEILLAVICNVPPILFLHSPKCKNNFAVSSTLLFFFKIFLMWSNF